MLRVADPLSPLEEGLCPLKEGLRPLDLLRGEKIEY
jgi:hypothetical protein